MHAQDARAAAGPTGSRSTLKSSNLQRRRSLFRVCAREAAAAAEILHKVYREGNHLTEPLGGWVRRLVYGEVSWQSSPWLGRGADLR